MTGKTIAWFGMVLCGLAVTGYALSVLVVPAVRSPLAAGLLAKHPIAAITHFLGGAMALAAGAFQVNSRLRLRFRAAHRWLGRLYVLAVAAAALSGFVLAIESSAGPFAQWGFALLAVCWFWSSANAYLHIRQHRWLLHRAWMIRSYALTLAAVTLRLYLPASQLAGVPIGTAYPAIAWLCWVPNLLAAEWIIRARDELRIPTECSIHRL